MRFCEFFGEGRECICTQWLIDVFELQVALTRGGQSIPARWSRKRGHVSYELQHPGLMMRDMMY